MNFTAPIVHYPVAVAAPVKQTTTGYVISYMRTNEEKGMMILVQEARID